MDSPPAWHTDPQDPRQLRWWDGQRWTDYRAPAPVPPTAKGWVARHPILTSALAILVVFCVLGAVFSGTDTETKPVAGQADSGAAEPADDATPTPEPTPTASPSPTVQQVAGPRLLGQPLATARRTLSRSDLLVHVRREVSRRRPGTVLRQSYAPGRSLVAGTAVTLVVSAPWPRVPDVRGISAPRAISRLQAAGFRVTTSLRRTTTGRDDVVLGQGTSPGRAVAPRSAVRLVLADLHAPRKPAAESCTPGYRPCLPPMSDYDCAGGSGNGPGRAQGPIYVTGSDPYDLDRDGDGVACEP